MSEIPTDSVRRVRLYCPGGYHGTAIAATGYLEQTCHKSQCRIPNGRGGWLYPVHVWDMETGWLTPAGIEQEPATTPAGESRL